MYLSISAFYNNVTAGETDYKNFAFKSKLKFLYIPNFISDGVLMPSGNFISNGI